MKARGSAVIDRYGCVTYTGDFHKHLLSRISLRNISYHSRSVTVPPSTQLTNPRTPKDFCIFEAIFWIHKPHELS